MNDVFPWTPAHIAALTDLWARGLPASKIAKQIGTTKNAVIGKCRRLGLPKRESPIQKKAPSAPVASPSARPVARPRPAPTAPNPPHREPAAVQPIFLPLPSPARDPALNRLPERKRQQPTCTWLFGERHSYRQCDNPVSRAGSSWCLDHAAIVFTKPFG